LHAALALPAPGQPADAARAVPLLEQALARDPRYERARVELARLKGETATVAKP
jgi:hypothetical protein